MKNFDTQHVGSIQIKECASVRAPQSADGAILLVEDDKVLRRYLEVLLRRAGYAVSCAADGVEAIKIAFGSKPAAVVTDAVMPRLGGHELCRILRSRAEHARLPIILLSGEARDDSAACAHADAQLTKPVRAEELLDCLKRLIASAAVV
ncbi:MAG: response regulator [Acidobacteria bacterium]|nr:response regulator [Acidobacteriota bacterium]MCA1642435.1 response regulator [Acidobacteriota bacterium]